jgi:glycosyltransferase involved in cell wall biosynthesis
VIKLSVILISKNQEWNVKRLVESVLEETKELSREVILVDSASTDGTVEVASVLPISVLRLSAEQRLTPAAGRYVGYQHTTGRLVLFMDGDMELCPGWLEKAMRVLRNRPDIAAITGRVIDLPKAAGPKDKPPMANEGTETFTEILYAGGAFLYRRSVLEQVGTFNPFLYSDEEPELCFRIRNASYRIVKHQYPIAYHYTDPSVSLSTKVGRWKRNLYLGAGQAIRYHLGDSVLWPYVRNRGYGLVPALGVLSGLVSLLWSIFSKWFKGFYLWAMLVGLLIAVDLVRRRDPYQTAVSLLERLLIADGTVRGFLLRPTSPDSYPVTVDIVKRATPLAYPHG